MKSIMEIKVECWDDSRLLVNSKFSGLLRGNGIVTAKSLWNIPGEPVKKKLKERGTERVFLKSSDGSEQVEAYIKRYLPLPVSEYFKSIISVKPLFPDGAFHEWEACLAFQNINLSCPEPIAVAKVGGKSCLLILGIKDYVRASELFAKFASGDRERKRRLISKIAEFAGRMHSANFAHQDFYLVHFFVREKDNDGIYLIDLQRVIMREKLSSRWVVKDLAQLIFSARPFVSKTDILFFWKTYTKIFGAELLYENKSFIKTVFAKAAKIESRNTSVPEHLA